ncbi:MAG: oligoribonuclease [Legionellaceae bacterium]|nr:oligoribonuclease [Legionellaceae bacterium]
MSAPSDNNLIWLDLEMTGLDFSKERIIEIATVVTDNELNVLAEGPVLAIHQSDELLEAMDKWNTKQHNKSGLVERVRNSQTTEQQAEQETIRFLKKYVSPGKSPMCGNSICTDRRFLYQFMPELEKFFHYRNLDVSTVKELASRWYGDHVVKAHKKDSQHLALQDIHDSIAELKHYRRHIFAEKNQPK